MPQSLYAEDPEPSDRLPAGLLFVPVRSGPAGCTPRFFRTPLGGRTAVGFTSPHRLIATLGIDQAWITLGEPALRALADPLGVRALTIDPQLAARAPASTPASAPPPQLLLQAAVTSLCPEEGRSPAFLVK
jgi:hypothetical protein